MAATALLEETGSEDAVTLRGVARRVGVSAPSLYDHFSGQGEILTAVVERAFDEFRTALDGAAAATPPSAAPQERLRALAQAYLAFATDHPRVYRVMFDRRRGEGTAEMTQQRGTEELVGGEAFALLVQAVCADGSETSEAMVDATAVWVTLHGYATLRDAVPAFPWPDQEVLLARLLDSRAR